MDRGTALELLRGGADGVAEWKRLCKANEPIPDLSEADLSEADLSEADLSRANLSDAILCGANLSRADLSKANLCGANLTRVDLSEANLCGADLAAAILSRAYLCGAGLTGADLSQAYLVRAALTGTDLTGVNLSGAILAGAKLSGADLAGAKLSETALDAANLSGANLSGADLSRASLSQAILVKANLTSADLSRAKVCQANLSEAGLSQADLAGADLSGADLTGAELREAILLYANLYKANLSGAVLRRAYVGETVFACDLSKAIGLSSVRHLCASVIDVHSILNCKEDLPEAFLSGCGLPDKEIAHYRCRVTAGRPVRSYSCFISYSTDDEAFATRLHNDFQAAGIRCWKWDHDARTGRSIWGEIDRAIRVYDKLVLIASESSLKSPAVSHEIERAIQQEDEKEKRRMAGKTDVDADVLFPVRLDDYIIETWQHDRKADVTKKVIADARGWDKDPTVYDKVFKRLIRAIKP